MESFTFHDLGRIAYADALKVQTEAFETLLHAKVWGGQGENKLFFCEHEPVLTIGKSGKDANLLIPAELLKLRISPITAPDRSPVILSSTWSIGNWD